jgi:heme ABC exporter ATP-binding subunit CcmA
MEGLTRRYGRTWALRGVNLSAVSGEVLGIEGSNGSGKTTLLRIAATLVRPTSGRVLVCGLDAVREAHDARGRVAMLTHSTGLYADLTARENLRFAATMLGVGDELVPGVLERLGLAAHADERVGRFSSGMQRRVALGRLMLRIPTLLLLDEPYNSFDASGVKLVNEVVRETASRGGAALVVLHDRRPATGVVHRWVRLREGLLSSADGRRESPGAEGAEDIVEAGVP